MCIPYGLRFTITFPQIKSPLLSRTRYIIIYVLYSYLYIICVVVYVFYIVKSKHLGLTHMFYLCVFDYRRAQPRATASHFIKEFLLNKFM